MDSDDDHPPAEGANASALRRFVVGPIVMAGWGLLLAWFPMWRCSNDTADPCDALCGHGSWKLFALIPAAAAFAAGLLATTEKRYRSLFALAMFSGLISWVVAATC